MRDFQMVAQQQESVAVLGGAGFVGTRLVELLLAEGMSVRIGDIEASKAHGLLSTSCDVRDLSSLLPLMEGVTVAFNLAAEHRDDVRPLSRYVETNVEGAINVCKAACETGVRKIVFTSSVAVYGFQRRPIDEYCRLAPFNEYGRTKREAEKVYLDWAAEDPTRTLVIIRPTVIFGEGNRGNVHNLIRQIASRRFSMVGSGNNVKSIAYVGNVAAFLLHVLTLGPGVHVFNYSDQPEMTTGELVEHIRNALGMSGRLKRIPKSLAMMIGHASDFAALVTRRTFPVSAIRVRKFCEQTQICADLAIKSGFSAPWTIAEGLNRTIKYDFID